MGSDRDRFVLRSRGHTGATAPVAYRRPATALEAIRAEETRGRYPYADRLELEPGEPPFGTRNRAVERSRQCARRRVR